MDKPIKKEEKKIEVQLGTKEYAFWTEIIESSEADIEKTEKILKFQKAILDMARVKQAKEKSVTTCI